MLIASSFRWQIIWNKGSCRDRRQAAEMISSRISSRKWRRHGLKTWEDISTRGVASNNFHVLKVMYLFWIMRVIIVSFSQSSWLPRTASSDISARWRLPDPRVTKMWWSTVLGINFKRQWMKYWRADSESPVEKERRKNIVNPQALAEKISKMVNYCPDSIHWMTITMPSTLIMSPKLGD